jgi:hypothetical protein
VTRVIYREKILRTDPRLGRSINHDSESRRYAYPARTQTLVTVRHRRWIDVLDQGDLGSCTGNAGIGCLGTDPFYKTLPASPTFSEDELGARGLYSAASQADPYPGEWPPDDTGSDGLTIAKVLAAAGMIAGYRHAFSLDAALAALQEQPVITGVNWHEGMYQPDPTGLVHPTGPVAGGHEFVADAYDADRGLVGFTNSWGTSWGLEGRFYLQAEDWGTLLGEQGDVTVFVPLTQPAPTPTPAPPDADDADRRLWDQTRAWAGTRHIGTNARAARAVRAWAARKGLT